MLEHTALLARSEDWGWPELVRMLSCMENVRIVGEARNVQQATALFTSVNPTLIIAASHLRGDSVIPFLAKARSDHLRKCKILIISSTFLPEELENLASLALNGHVLWNDLTASSLHHLLTTVLCSDIITVSPTKASAFIAGRQTPEQSLSSPISDRERTILCHLRNGVTHEQIALLESISRRTVERVIASLEVKLDAPTQFALGCRSMQYGLLENAEGGRSFQSQLN